MLYVVRVTMATNEQTGKAVERLRKLKRLTQQQLADRTELHVATIRRVEAGGSSETDTIKRIAEALVVGASELLEVGR